MKYIKVVDNIFEGFYDKDIHGDIVYGEDFQEISDERWRELLDGQSKGKEIRILRDGELGLYQVPPIESEMIKPKFNYITEKWEELATEEEQLQYWEDRIIANQSDMYVRQQAGLRPTAEQLKLKEIYLNNHMKICAVLATRINDKLK